MQAPKPYRDQRPWGDELWFTRDCDAPSMVKLLNVNPGETLSLQYHNDRQEYWYVISGSGTAEISGEKILLQKGVECFVPATITHRISGGNDRLTILELAFGRFDENDIVRIEDKYGR